MPYPSTLCRASGLRPSYYPFGYHMMYASEEKEKTRMRRGRRKKREEGKHGCMVRGGHGLLRVSLELPMYGLRVATPETASRPFIGVAACRASSLWPSYYPFQYPMKYASGEWGRESKERGVKKGKRKRKGGGERMGVWQEVAMDSLKYH
jgi:hypothetical protein